VSHAAGELWDFRDKGIVFRTPIDNDFVAVHYVLSPSLYLTMISRIWRT
jgi:hypothetical protein